MIFGGLIGLIAGLAIWAGWKVIKLPRQSRYWSLALGLVFAGIGVLFGMQTSPSPSALAAAGVAWGLILGGLGVVVGGIIDLFGKVLGDPPHQVHHTQGNEESRPYQRNLVLRYSLGTILVISLGANLYLLFPDKFFSESQEPDVNPGSVSPSLQSSPEGVPQPYRSPEPYRPPEPNRPAQEYRPSMPNPLSDAPQVYEPIRPRPPQASDFANEYDPSKYLSRDKFSYDIRGARNAGLNDREIAEYLARQTGVDLESMMSEGGYTYSQAADGMATNFDMLRRYYLDAQNGVRP